jgi:hypothetical protein
MTEREYRDIPSDQWPAFFDQFSRAHHDQEADVETTGIHVEDAAQARGLRLLGIAAEREANKDLRIDVIAGDAAGQHTRTGIRRPVCVQVAEWNDTVSAELRIDSEDGRTTRVWVGPREQTLPPGFITDGLWQRD